jgi:hypothetical protein
MIPKKIKKVLVEYGDILLKKEKDTLKYAKKLKIKMKDNKYYHLSNNKISEVSNVKQHGSWLGSIYYNPYGLWFSCGSSWIDFCIKNKKFYWLESRYLYEIEVNDNVKKINNIKEFKLFFKKYQNEKAKKFKDLIKWKEIKKDYDGLIICPYLGTKIWKNKSAENSYGFYNEKVIKILEQTFGKKLFNYDEFLYEWYRHWEVASGVIWNKEGIKSINLIHEKS